METSIKDANKLSLLTLVECEDLNRPVGIDDMEEFSSKVRQIGEHNTKAIFISTNSFQKSAYNYAKSEGISLIRISTNDELEWVNFRKDAVGYRFNALELENLFIQEVLSEPFVCDFNQGKYNNFADLPRKGNLLQAVFSMY